jgi:outer membrane receptor for ferric coprogen and ferric-rhodotorulic acid
MVVLVAQVGEVGTAEVKEERRERSVRTLSSSITRANGINGRALRIESRSRTFPPHKESGSEAVSSIARPFKGKLNALQCGFKRTGTRTRKEPRMKLDLSFPLTLSVHLYKP